MGGCAECGDVAGDVRGVVVERAVVTRLSGSSTSSFADGSNADFNLPEGVTVDASGNVFVADTHNHRLCKATAFVGMLALQRHHMR